MVQVDGHRHGGAPGRRLHGWHEEVEFEMGEMGFGQRQDDRREDAFRRRQDAFQEIHAGQVESAHGVAVLIGVIEQIFHIDQGHGGLLSGFVVEFRVPAGGARPFDLLLVNAGMALTRVLRQDGVG